MKKEAMNSISCTFEKIAKEQKKKNVTARAIGSGALGAIGGGIASDITTGGGIGNKRSRQIGSATGIGSLAGIASYSALKHNMDKKGDAEARRRLQEKGIDTSNIKKGLSPKSMAKQIVLNSRAN